MLNTTLSYQSLSAFTNICLLQCLVTSEGWYSYCELFYGLRAFPMKTNVSYSVCTLTKKCIFLKKPMAKGLALSVDIFFFHSLFYHEGKWEEWGSTIDFATRVLDLPLVYLVTVDLSLGNPEKLNLLHLWERRGQSPATDVSTSLPSFVLPYFVIITPLVIPTPLVIKLPL